MSGPQVRQLRILIGHRQRLLRLCSIAFTDKDASIYLFPYAPNNRFYVGGRSMPQAEFTDTFTFTDDLLSDTTPKLSIHQSGQVHILAGDTRIGPLRIPPLSTLRGQHIASVTVDAFSVLSEFTSTPKAKGKDQDHVIPAEDNAASGRIALYLAGDRPAFQAQECPIVITLKRPSLPSPLYLGIKPIGQPVLGEPDPQGITVLAGWDPTGQIQRGADYLYVRGL